MPSILSLSRRLFSLLGFTAMLTALACGGTVSEPSAEDQEELVGGRLVNSHPDVGFYQVIIGGTNHQCTGTLISPHVVLTAAHCLSFKNQVASVRFDPEINYFLIGKPTGPAWNQIKYYRYPIAGYISYGSALGDNDVALVHLASPVSSTVAAPYKYARVDPPRGTPIADYGYGCTSLSTLGGGGWQYKRRIDTTLGGPKYFTCPGDSGGPLMASATGVFRVNSSYCRDRSCPNGFGNVTKASSWITYWVEYWH